MWQPTPGAVRDRFKTALPRGQRDLEEVLADFRMDVVPYVTGNTHPMFMGWVHGAGTPSVQAGGHWPSGLPISHS